MFDTPRQRRINALQHKWSRENRNWQIANGQRKYFIEEYGYDPGIRYFYDELDKEDDY